MKYVALVIAGLYAVIYFYGGPLYASCSCNAAGGKTLPYYFIGIATLLSYLAFYAYRKVVEDKRQPVAEELVGPTPAPIAGASEL